MHLRIIPLLFLVLLLSAGAFENDNERFLQVLKNCRDDTLKTRLIRFARAGLERPVKKVSSVQDAILKARSYLGVPYRMGGMSGKGMDCSGLIKIAFKEAGIELPHSTQEQARYGRIIPNKSHLQKGDLVFFYNSYKTRRLITHSGIFLGDGTFIHASRSKGVMITRLQQSPFWRERYLFATRLVAVK